MRVHLFSNTSWEFISRCTSSACVWPGSRALASKKENSSVSPCVASLMFGIGRHCCLHQHVNRSIAGRPFLLHEYFPRPLFPAFFAASYEGLDHWLLLGPNLAWP